MDQLFRPEGAVRGERPRRRRQGDRHGMCLAGQVTPDTAQERSRRESRHLRTGGTRVATARRDTVKAYRTRPWNDEPSGEYLLGTRVPPFLLLTHYQVWRSPVQPSTSR